MGELKCRCGANAKAKTFEEADSLIDHSIALIRGNGCDGNPINMTWNGKPVAKLSSLVESKKPSPPKKNSPPKKVTPKKGGKSKKKKEDEDSNEPEPEPSED